MENYNAIIELINNNLDEVDFAEFGDGSSDIRIEEAQIRLNVIFPPSYIWWLKNYGGGTVIGDEIYSVYETSSDLPSGDIVYTNELDRKNGFSDKTKLVIQTNDQGQTFYFDLLNPDKSGEYPVYCVRGDYKNKYADNFLKFLESRIKDIY